MASEFQPCNFVDTLVDEIDLMCEGGEKLPSIETALPVSASLIVTTSPPVNPSPGHKTPQGKEKEEFTLKPKGKDKEDPNEEDFHAQDKRRLRLRVT